MTVNSHYNSHRVDWTKTQAAPGSTRTDGISRTSGPGGDMPVKVVEGERSRLATVGGKVTLETPNGVLEFGTGMDALESIKAFLGEADGLNQLDEGSINKLNRYLGELKKNHFSNSAILDMIELMQLMVEIHQKEWETLNLMRQGEGVRARNELQQKANLTRAGASQNFAMSMVGSSIGLLFSAYSLKSSISSLKNMTNTLNKGIDIEKMELMDSAKLTDPQSAETHANLVEFETGRAADPNFRYEASVTTKSSGRVGVTETPGGSETPGEPETPVEKTAEEKTVEQTAMEREAEEPKLPSKEEVVGGDGQPVGDDDDFHLLKDGDVTSKPEKPGVQETGTPPPLEPEGTPEPAVTEKAEGGILERMVDGKGADRIKGFDRSFTKTREMLFDEHGEFRITDSEGKPIPRGEWPLKPDVTEADLKNAKTVRQAMELLDLKPGTGSDAEAANKVKADIRAQLSAALEADYQNVRGSYTMLKSNMDSLSGDIEAGTFDEVKFKNEAAAKAELAKMKGEAEVLKGQLRYMNAVKTCGQAKCMDAKSIAAVQSDLQEKLDTAKHKVINGSEFKTYDNRLQMANAWSGLGNAFKDIFAGIGNFLQSERQAEVTEAEIEQSRRQEEMDSLHALIDKNRESLRGLMDLMEAALMSGTDTRATMA